MAIVTNLRELVERGFFRQEYSKKVQPKQYDRKLAIPVSADYVSSIDMSSEFAADGVGTIFENALSVIAQKAAVNESGDYQIYFLKGDEAERLSVNCMHVNYINLAANFVLRLVPYVNTNYDYNYVVCHDAPEHMIKPTISLLKSLRNAPVEQMSSSAKLLCDVVDLAFKLVSAKQIRPYTFAINDVNSAQLKYGVYWVPNLLCKEVLDTIQGLDSLNNDVSMRMITFNSRTDSKKLRYRESPIASLLSMIISEIIVEFAPQDITNANCKMLFSGNKLVTNRPESIAKHQDLTSWARGL